MESSIKFLGTAGNVGVVAKDLRKSGGIIICSGDVQLHIDPGPGALTNAQKFNVNIRENTAVLVSHSHLNHCNDVNAVLSAMSHNRLDIRGVLIANKTLLDDPESVLTDYHKLCVEKVIPADVGKTIGVEHVEITPLYADHHDKQAVGFKIVTPDFSLVYSGDTNYSQDIADQYLRADVLILNTPNAFGSNEKGLSSSDVVNILKLVSPDLAIITHFGKSLLQAPPLYEAREIQKQTKVTVIAAEDGLEVNPLNYLKENKQKTLQFLSKQAESTNSQ
ncbi:MBL fold metallo-hydrolase [Candidatus Woesearchaeota archaeon]|nr:MBL fold metallo-hydrolase [Candidatus Woesearchaeota archaeon]